MMEAAAVKQVIVVGANHRSSSLALRDQLCVEEPAMATFLGTLRDYGLTQALVLSTCDRVEVIGAHPDGDLATRAATAAFARHAGIDREALAGRLYRIEGQDAVRHCFAVAAALDSLVIGEPHVLGQIKEAHRLAQAAGMIGGELEGLLQAAYAAAKRVRSETAIAEGPVSIAAVAVQLARDLHGDLSRCEALLVGTGDMGELVTDSLRAAGCKRFVVTATREAHAEMAAKELSGHVVPLADLAGALVSADIVLTSLSGRQIAIGADIVRVALRKRRQRPIFLIDAGIPGDIEPAVNELANAFLYDLNDLERVAMAGRASREQAARSAWDIVGAEVQAFLRGRAERSAVPAIQALRQHVEELRLHALAEAGGDAERATQLLVGRLLHAPSEAMREIAAAGEAGRAEWAATERMVRRLFRLDPAMGEPRLKQPSD